MKNLFMAAFVVALTFTMSQTTSAQDNAHFGIGLSRAKADLDCPNTCDETGVGLRVFYGQSIVPQLDYEIGFTYHGESQTITAQPVTFDWTAGSIYGAAIGKISLGTSVELFGKLGAHGWYFKAEDSIGTLSDDNDSGFGLNYGAGANFAIDERNVIRLEYDVYKMKPKVTATAINGSPLDLEGDYDVSHITLAYIRRF